MTSVTLDLRAFPLKTTLPASRIARAGFVAVVLAVAAAAGVRSVAAAAGVDVAAPALAWPGVLAASAAGAALAVAAYALLARFTRQPVRNFLALSWLVLLGSLGGPLTASGQFEGVTPGVVATLVALHVVVAAASVSALVAIARPVPEANL